MSAAGLEKLAREVVACTACPRLVEWRRSVARAPRSAHAGERYWARPLPGTGDPAPWLVLVGLAPAAHGANRTGRMFTGDRSGDFLVAALHRAGLASAPVSRHREDGLRLTGCRLTAAVRCAPPANRPSREERARCRPYLARELDLCPDARVVVALGGLAWEELMRLGDAPRPRPRFGHGAEAHVGGRIVLGCYHPSQQNTFTGRLTPAMIDAVLTRARALRPPGGAGAPTGSSSG